MIKNLPVYVSLTLQNLAVAVFTARFKFKISTFCPNRIFIWFLRISEKATTVYQKSLKLILSTFTRN